MVSTYFIGGVRYPDAASVLRAYPDFTAFLGSKAGEMDLATAAEVYAARAPVPLIDVDDLRDALWEASLARWEVPA